MHVSLFCRTANRCVETTTNSSVGDRKTIGQTKRNTAKECITVVLEPAVPTFDVSTVKRDVIAIVVCEQCTCVSERLAVVHGVSVAVEKVASSLNNFPTNDGVEVSNLNGHVAVASLKVKLWQCVAVLTTSCPTFVRVVARNRVAKGHSIGSVSTVDIINTSTDVKTTRAVDCLLGEQPTLLELNIVSKSVEVCSGVSEVTQLQPATNSDPVALTEERVRVAQAAVIQTKTIYDRTVAKATTH